MTSAGGLSRRRVPNVSSSTNTSDDPDDAWGLSPSPTNGANNGNGALSHHSSLHSVSHAGSAFEGGSKIAYDPRDLEREDEDVRQGGRAPWLTIMEEVLLLGLKDKQVSNPSLFKTSACGPHFDQTYHESAPAGVAGRHCSDSTAMPCL